MHVITLSCLMEIILKDNLREGDVNQSFKYFLNM